MKTQLESKTNNVKQFLLELEKEKFIIPVFQRNYSWTKKQCEKFIDDIFKTKEESHSHFIGNIITKRLLNNMTFVNDSIIIDGQQRVTTIFLMIKALIDIAIDEKDINQLKSYLFLENGSKKIQLNINDNEDFYNLLDNELNKVNEKSNIYLNYLFFKDFFSKKIEKLKISIEDIISLFFNAIFVQIFLGSEDNAQLIFERINSSGIKLKNPDLIRNFLLMSESNQEELYRKYWMQIEEVIGTNNMDIFIQHYLIYKTDKTTPKESTYEVFKEEYHKNNLERESILSEMKKISNIYSIIIQNELHIEKKVNDILKEIIIINQTTCYPFLIHLIEDFNNEVISIEILISCLFLIRNYLLRRAIVDKNSKNLNKFFSSLYSKIFIDNMNKKYYYDSIANYFIQISTSDRFPTDGELSNSLKNDNFYFNKSICKYTLFSIEHYNSKELINDTNISIEHIMPQNKTDDWAIEIGRTNYEHIMSKYLHNLGNLSLTAYNSNLSDMSYKKKKEILLNIGIKIRTLNKEIFDNDNWSEEIIKRRCERLTGIILQVFYYPNSLKNIIYKEFIDPIKTLEDYGELNGTKISKFSMNDVTFFVKDYNELFQKVLKELCLINKEKIFELARNDFSLKGKKQIDLSLSQNKIRKTKKVLDEEIYYNKDYSPTDIVLFIEKLYEELKLDKKSLKMFIIDKNKN